jgi:uncharacterized protein
MTDQEFVEYVVKALVDHPEDVSVKRSVDDMGVLIELTVRGEDMGKVIGKDGRTAKSIRTLLRVLGAKNDERVNMKIVEPEGEGGSTKNESAPEASAEAQPEVAEEAPEETPEAEETTAAESEPEAAPESSQPAAEESNADESSAEPPAPEKKRDHLAGLGDSPLDSLEV